MVFWKKYWSIADLGFLALVGAYILICWLIASVNDYGDHFSPLMYLSTGAQLSVTFFLGYVLYRLVRAVVLLFKEKPGRPLGFLWQDLRAGPLRADIYIRVLPVFIGFLFFFSTFSSMKMLIGKIQYFPWDPFFMRLDQMLHFSLDPWRIIQPVLGYPIVSKAISFAYIFWLLAFFLVLYWQLFRFKDEKLRAQFFYAFVLVWGINGTFLALYFSSAGPCFYESVTGSAHFAPLMDYLYSVNEHYKIYALKTQELLWKNFTAGETTLASGISAFPSVHVATVFLFVLMSRHMHKLIFGGFIIFFVLILLGSVHLGWHYAVDGYASIVTTAILWWVSGKIVRRLSAVPG